MTKTLFTPVNIGLLVLIALVTILGYLFTPVGVPLPVHWGFDGVPDNYLPREYALLSAPALAIGLIIVFAVIGRYGARGSTEKGAAVIGAASTAMLLIALGLQGATVLIGMGYGISMMQVVASGLAALAVLLGNALPKSQPNAYAGIRIPSTLNDPANWQATHRLTGILLIVGGAIALIASLLLPPGALMFSVALGGLVVPMLIGVVYSIAMARRHARS